LGEDTFWIELDVEQWRAGVVDGAEVAGAELHFV
jgi:hypothetical protein